MVRFLPKIFHKKNRTQSKHHRPDGRHSNSHTPCGCLHFRQSYDPIVIVLYFFLFVNHFKSKTEKRIAESSLHNPFWYFKSHRELPPSFPPIRFW